MMQKTFPISFWNYCRPGELGAKSVEDWEELGISAAMSPEYDRDVNGAKANMLEILDACAAHGIAVTVCDHRTRWEGAAADPEGYRARFREAYADFGHHPAVAGFFVGDEPTDDAAFADCAAAHRIQLEEAPELTPFINFLSGFPQQDDDLNSPATCGPYADDFIRRSGLKILCYDCYTQMNPDENGVQRYFEALRKHVGTAEQFGIEPWTTLLSVGHFNYRVPNEDGLRWQLNTAVASGMKGILWFYLYHRYPGENYRLAPFDEFWRRTETFDRMSRTNRYFLRQFGDFFVGAKHLGTYHIYKSFGGYPLFERCKSDPIIREVTCAQSVPGVVGIFEKDGGRYIAVVNNSTTENGTYDVHLPKGAKIFQRLNWSLGWEDVKDNHWDGCYYETEEECINCDWLAPGQMKVYRVG